MNLTAILPEAAIVHELRASTKHEAIRELAVHLSALHEEIAVSDVIRVLEERELLGSTAIGQDLAIPHGKLASAPQLVACFGRSRKGIAFGAEDGRPTRFFFVLIAPEGSAGDHLKALARISRCFRSSDFRARLAAAKDSSAIHQVIEHEDFRALNDR